MIGYGSVGSVAMLNVWIDSRKGTARDSLYLLREAEGMMAGLGAKIICLPVAQTSPFLPHVERLGYTPLGWASYNLKRLNQG